MSNLISVKDYAERVGLSPSTIYSRIKSGKLKSVIKNEKKYIVLEGEEIEKRDKQAVIEYKTPEVEIIESKRVDEIESLQQEIKKMKERIKLFDTLVEENIALNRENRELLSKIFLYESTSNPDIEIEYKKEVELVEYLISLGITKKERSKIVKKFKKRRDENRIIERAGKFYLNLNRYNYDDLIGITKD